MRHPTFGASLSVDWAGGTAYVDIGQVADIVGPNISRESIEVPVDHDMPDNYKQFFPGVADGGQITFELNLDPSNSAHVGAQGTGLLGSFEDTDQCTLPAWRYQGPGMCGGTATWTADGFVVGMDFDMGAVQGSMKASLTIEVSGKPSLMTSYLLLEDGGKLLDEDGDPLWLD